MLLCAALSFRGVCSQRPRIWTRRGCRNGGRWSSWLSSFTPVIIWFFPLFALRSPTIILLQKHKRHLLLSRYVRAGRLFVCIPSTQVHFMNAQVLIQNQIVSQWRYRGTSGVAQAHVCDTFLVLRLIIPSASQQNICSVSVCFRLKAPSDRFICAPYTHVHGWNTLSTSQNHFVKIRLYPLHIVLFCMSWMIHEADQNRYFDAVLTVLDLFPVSISVV